MDSPERNTDEPQEVDGCNNGYCDVDTGENSNDSVEAQPQTPEDDEDSNEYTEQQNVMTTATVCNNVAFLFFN